ncbi:MAG: NosD domain-containing protein, partial [Candidatus Nanoarchaeia archaeon]|nr:right-handed parallel beta-helix repeat-containing protein [Candidatus Jingweiarchaeum tengchongense]
MEKKLFFLLEIFLFLFLSHFVFAQEDFLKIPGVVKGEGTHFEIKDSEYLNIILDSEKEISLILESMPKMVSLSINSSTDATSTILVISGLENNKTYYKYEDSYRNGIEISVGENGQYSWQQDLTKSHHLWFQEKKGTIFIPFNPENPTDPKSCVPPYGIWDEGTRTCVLTQNLTESVEITTSSITFDCNLFSIIGDGTGYGIYLNSKTNVEIKNCTITNFSEGIFLDYSSDNNFIHNNSIFKNEWLGIDVLGSSNNRIKENTIFENLDGIRLGSVWFYSAFYNLINENKVNNNKDLGVVLVHSNFNKIEKNEISDNGSDDGVYNAGLFLNYSSYNEVIENTFSNNKWTGILVEGWWDMASTQNKIVRNNISNNEHGILLAYYAPENYFRENVLIANEFNFGIRFDARFAPYIYFQDIDTSNTVDKKPIYYLKNQQGQVLDSSSNAGFVGVINSENIIVKDLVIKNSFDGILFYNSKNSKIENVKLENNLHGIGVYSSSGIEIERSEIINNGVGISLIDSSNSQIKRNIISGNGGGSMVWWYVNGGIVQTGSANNIFFENEISKNKGVGIYLGSSNNNKVFHNNFIENQGLDQYLSMCREKQFCIYKGVDNFFDNGYPSGGNYWSDYIGKDEKSGPNQDQTGSDGIGDAPYCLWTGCDRYPFMQANGWSLPKVLISEVYYDVDRGKDPDNEWIILYNPHNEPIDISGWKIEDNYATDTIPQSPIIPPRGFAIISASSTTFDYWKIPKNMVKIVLENKRIGNGLNNSGDRIILKDKEGNIIDA